MVEFQDIIKTRLERVLTDGKTLKQSGEQQSLDRTISRRTSCQRPDEMETVQAGGGAA